MRAKTVFFATLMLAFIVFSAKAQIVDPDSLPHDLPDGPAKPGFGISRFSTTLLSDGPHSRTQKRFFR